MKWSLYVLIKDGKCVYVGATSDPSRRKKQHRKDKVFDEMYIIKEYETKELCFNAENAIISFVTLFGDGNWYNAENVILSYKRDLELRTKIYVRRLD